MMRTLRLTVVDDKFFTRSKSGAIWGRVYFEIGDSFFPDKGWTDLIAAFTTAWLEALTRIATGSVPREHQNVHRRHRVATHCLNVVALPSSTTKGDGPSVLSTL
jgi:hypothetical protein